MKPSSYFKETHRKSQVYARNLKTTVDPRSLSFWLKTVKLPAEFLLFFLSYCFGPAPVLHSYFFFFFNPRGGKMERQTFVFRLNCLYIQHLKYILFCCTLVSKFIRFYWNIKRHLKPDWWLLFSSYYYFFYFTLMLWGYSQNQSDWQMTCFYVVRTFILLVEWKHFEYRPFFCGYSARYVDQIDKK